MSVEIKSEHIDIGGQSVLLVAVRDGTSVIGTCSSGHNMRRGDTSGINRMFYIGNEPVVNMLCPNHGDKRNDKLISICGGFVKMPDDINHVLKESFNKVNRGDSLEIGLRDLFSLLSNGLYTVHTSECYPTDGTGAFFWGAYNIAHEVHGTAEHNRTIGALRTFRPCFLIPGASLDCYVAKKMGSAQEAVKSQSIHGIAYHLTGFHSVLLVGHHNAAACAAADIPFRCAVIERISEPYSEPFWLPPPPPEPVPEEGAAEEQQAEQPKAPAIPVEREGITGFRSASVKIPLELLPKDMLRVVLETRPDAKPEQFSNLLRKVNTVRRKVFSNNIVPHIVLERCDLMPDCDIMESAFAVDGLSGEQLTALLAGETEYNGQIIISPNFYTSVVTACNYLQFSDRQRFVDFALAILENPELSATHEYIAKRVSRVDNKRIYGFFKNVLADEEDRYEKIIASAQRYVQDYDVAH